MGAASKTVAVMGAADTGAPFGVAALAVENGTETESAIRPPVTKRALSVFMVDLQDVGQKQVAFASMDWR
ncbi:MAG: hypothetical protein AAGJ50_06410 [Pseudomonadota bacterium]